MTRSAPAIAAGHPPRTFRLVLQPHQHRALGFNLEARAMAHPSPLARRPRAAEIAGVRNRRKGSSTKTHSVLLAAFDEGTSVAGVFTSSKCPHAGRRARQPQARQGARPLVNSGCQQRRQEGRRNRRCRPRSFRLMCPAHDLPRLDRRDRRAAGDKLPALPRQPFVSRPARRWTRPRR